MIQAVKRQIEVQVNPNYLEQQSLPEQQHYVFTYTVVIQNTGNVTVKLLSRHWIITNSDGYEEEVKGEGVVGEQPILAPGESFRYTSGAVLETPLGTMQGSYEFMDDRGVLFATDIPLFRLRSRDLQVH